MNLNKVRGSAQIGSMGLSSLMNTTEAHQDQFSQMQRQKAGSHVTSKDMAVAGLQEMLPRIQHSSTYRQPKGEFMQEDPLEHALNYKGPFPQP